MSKPESYYQYRYRYNGTESEIMTDLPTARWERVCDNAEERGAYAVLERRLITSSAILPMLIDRTGYIQDGDIVVCPWRILAEADFVGS